MALEHFSFDLSLIISYRPLCATSLILIIIPLSFILWFFLISSVGACWCKDDFSGIPVECCHILYILYILSFTWWWDGIWPESQSWVSRINAANSDSLLLSPQASEFKEALTLVFQLSQKWIQMIQQNVHTITSGDRFMSAFTECLEIGLMF